MSEYFHIPEDMPYDVQYDPQEFEEALMQAMMEPINDMIIYNPLFGRWISSTKALQEQWYGKDFENFTQQELEDWIRINVLAAEDELHEALAEVSWKPWAKSEFFNREAFLGECVDVLHFVGNLLAGAGITDQELCAAYEEKQNRNVERQKANYTGLDKCVECGRALDDVIAHGGWINRDREEGPTCSPCIESQDNQSTGSGSAPS